MTLRTLNALAVAHLDNPIGNLRQVVFLPLTVIKEPAARSDANVPRTRLTISTTAPARRPSKRRRITDGLLYPDTARIAWKSASRVTIVAPSSAAVAGFHGPSHSTSRCLRRECIHIPGHATDLQHRAVRPDPVSAGPLWVLSRCCGFRAVLEIGRGKRQRLLNVVRLQFRIVSKQVIAVWIQGNCFHYSTHGQPHPADARLPIHLVWIPGDPVELLHASLSYMAASGASVGGGRLLR
jgi:hypothetical protein